MATKPYMVAVEDSQYRMKNNNFQHPLASPNPTTYSTSRVEKKVYLMC